MSVEVIAEIGVNHNGDLSRALKLCDDAKECGAQVAKHQASFPRLETSTFHALEHVKMIEGVILTHHQLEQVDKHCQDIGIEFMCTPAEEQSLAWLWQHTSARRIKISSDNLPNHPFLRKIAAHGMPVILSTGMAELAEIWDAYEVLREALPADKISLLHCTSAYPCPISEANLLAIPTMIESFRLCAGIGWSDHTQSMHLASIAVALGAEIIEKHITRGGAGPDHAASLFPQQFRMMVDMIRTTEAALGDGTKRRERTEQAVALSVRKSIVAAKPLEFDEVITLDKLAVKRPGGGRPPKDIKEIVGTHAARRYAEGEMI